MKLIIQDEFLDPARCAALIALTDKGVSSASTQGCGVRYQLPESPAIRELRDSIAAVAGIGRTGTTAIVIHRYGPGDAQQAHSDRVTATAILYLEAPDSGGRTSFPVADVSIEPKAGRLVVWRNFLADGSQDPAALHESLKVTAGTKTALIGFIEGDRL